MSKNTSINSHLDVNQIAVKLFDSDNDAQRVVIVGQEIDMSGVTKALEEGLKNLQMPEIKLEQQAMPQIEKQVEIKIVEIEKPIIVEKIVYKEIQVPMIVREYLTQEIEKPVIIKEIEYKEVEKPIVIEKETIITPKLIYIFLGLQILLTLIAILKK